ncbi:Predicted membrane protein [Ceraceosorus bombacis]|uniref:Predicted membrane protein n=1 Tax=Ceraceosorus bombacis TaxID=401625 RepID=A0A0P1B9S2_9BASI|nr:Predicted membrane protein [Ceraceosorus bombacis]
MSDSSNEVLVNVFGTLGAVLWSVQLLPQIYLNHRRRQAQGVQPSFMMLWAVSGLALGVHNVLANVNIALQVQAQILTALSLSVLAVEAGSDERLPTVYRPVRPFFAVTWAQIMYFEHEWSKLRTCLTTASLAFAFAGVEAALIAGLRYGLTQGPPRWFLTFMAVLAAVGLALGVLREYVDILRTQSTQDLSLIFVYLDAGGDLTSLISVALASPLSIESIVIYASELLLWIGIMVLAVWFGPMKRWRHWKATKAPAISIEQHVEDVETTQAAEVT